MIFQAGVRPIPRHTAAAIQTKRARPTTIQDERCADVMIPTHPPLIEAHKLRRDSTRSPLVPIAAAANRYINLLLLQLLLLMNLPSQPAIGAESASRPPAAPAPKSGPPGKNTGKTGFVEGKDYEVWERVRVKDENGFSQPVEAYSILLPKGWKVEGKVQWVVNVACPGDAVQNRITARSPDGRFRMEVFPVRNWQWFDDPTMQQSARYNAQVGSQGCPVSPAYDAAQYLENVMVPIDLPGAQLVSHQRNEPMTRALMEQARAANAMFQASGVRLENRPSAEIGRLRWPDGRVGVALCAVGQTVSFMPNFLTGGVMAGYQCQANVKTVMIAPAGHEQEAERLLGTIVASTRVNPQWQAAVQQVFGNIAKVEQQETAKRAAIWRQTQNEIGELQKRTWEQNQASQDRIHEEWGRALRGIDKWTEPGGGSVELSAGYRDAWSKGDGTYILSNDPLFDPNVALQENWKRLEKAR